MRFVLLCLVLAAIYFGNQPRELHKHTFSSDRSYYALASFPGPTLSAESNIKVLDDSSVVDIIMCDVSFGYTIGDYVSIFDSLSQ